MKKQTILKFFLGIGILVLIIQILSLNFDNLSESITSGKGISTLSVSLSVLAIWMLLKKVGQT